MRPAPTLTVDVLLGSEDLPRQLREEVRTGLTSDPKALQPKWFYDDRGSRLFEEITRLPAYYPTRAERAILVGRAGSIVAASGADTLVELGSGTSEKTRALLDAMAGAGRLERFIPFDVSEATLREAAAAVTEEYRVDVHAVCGDFDHHLEGIPTGGRRLIAFLGGTIGNFPPPKRRRFLLDVAEGLGEGDTLLLGTDLVKDVRRLERAYDDPQGITAEFNRNVLHVLNRELDADFDPDAFEHVARWDPEHEWVEMLLRSTREQEVRVRALDLDVPFDEGEEMQTEISAKFRRAGVEAELAAAGLELVDWWTDPDEDFALSLSRRA